MDIGSVSPKDFLTAKEQQFGKKFTVGFWAAAIIGGGLALKVLMPIILAFLATLTQGLAVGILVAVAVAIGALLLNDSFRAMLADHFNGFVRWIVKGSVGINPLERVWAYANEYLQGKLEQVQGSTRTVQTLSNENTEMLASKKDDLAKAMHEADFRMRRSSVNGIWKDTEEGRTDQDEFQIASQQVQLLRDAITELNKNDAMYKLLLTLLDKIERAFSLSIRQTQNTVKIVADKYIASEAMKEAVRTVGGVLQGSDPRTQMYNMTMDYISHTIASNVAEVEGFYDRTKSIIASSDLQSDMAQEALMKELSDMSAKTDQATETLSTSVPTSPQDMVARAQGARGVSASTASGNPGGDLNDLYNRLHRRN